MELPSGWTLFPSRAWTEGAECLCFETPKKKKNRITVLNYTGNAKDNFKHMWDYCTKGEIKVSFL